MTNQVLIASYKRDFEWLYYCLKSLKKYSLDFLPPVISVDQKDEDGARRLVERAFPEATVYVKNEMPHQGNLRAQISMMSGDILCPDADFVWLVGSDCLVWDKFHPEPFFHEGKPVMLINSYAHLHTIHPDTIPWQKGTENILGFRPDHEYMRRLPLLYPKDLFPLVRAHISDLKGQPFEDHVYLYGRLGGRDFSESNIMGAYAYRYRPDMYHWVNRDGNEAYAQSIKDWPNPMIQFWSHGGLDFPADCNFNYTQGGNTNGKTPRQIIREVLGDVRY